MRFWLFLLPLLLLIGCYEPKSGCLDIDATNYEVGADDPCADCCKYPLFSLLVQHHIVPAAQPDTSILLKYGTPYQSPQDTHHFFYLDRGRFFISDLKLIRQNGQEVGVQDSFWLKLNHGDSIFVEDNFVKSDRDIFQASSIGTMITSGIFTGVKFTLGLSELVKQAAIDSLEMGHPLALKGDTLNYDTLLGYIPMRLILRPDTLPGTLPLDLHLTDPKQITLAFSQPVSIERGFNIQLTLRINYMALFAEVDFQQDSEATIRSKIDSQLTNAFSIVALKVE